MKKRLSIETKAIIYFFDPDEVLYCKSSNTSTTLYFIDDEPIVISKRLKEIESLIDDPDFIHPHQSYLVNKNHILLIERVSGYHLILRNQERIPISTRRRKAIMDFVQVGFLNPMDSIKK